MFHVWVGGYKKKTNWTSHHIQNEIIGIFSRLVLQKIVREINEESVYFGLVVDGTQDIEGKNQESICIRHINQNFEIKEDFLGLYQTEVSTGETISNVVKDALIRLQLPITNLRSQTYDGAPNMSGHISGVQTLIKKEQPLALFVHCGAHVMHLCVSKAVEKSLLIKDSLLYVNELGKLYKQSGKFKNLFLSQGDLFTSKRPSSLKPICPSRWLTRSPAIKAVLENYEYVLSTLDNHHIDGFKPLHTCFSNSKTVLGLCVSLPLLEAFEQLNASLQSPVEHVDGMLQSVGIILNKIETFRSPEWFSAVFTKAQSMSEELGLEAISEKRTIKRPKRYLDNSSPNAAVVTIEEKIRIQFNLVLERAKECLENYFNSPDLKKYNALANVLFTGIVDRGVIAGYPELHHDALERQLAMYRENFSGNNLRDHLYNFKGMSADVRRLFPAVETLLRLLLIHPASSCEAERSFSALRRLKTWLRSTMKQPRLNHVTVGHIHKNILSNISNEQVAREFVAHSADRKRYFGSF